MIWLALTWLGLIALWGASEAWSLAAARRRVARAVHVLHHHGEAHPFDWAERAPTAAGRW